MWRITVLKENQYLDYNLELEIFSKHVKSTKIIWSKGKHIKTGNK